jgi:hypothetical protein
VLKSKISELDVPVLRSWPDEPDFFHRFSNNLS